MITVAELASIIGVTKDRAKQLVLSELESSPSLFVQKGSLWRLGPEICKNIISNRGFSYPQKKVVTFAALKGGIGKTTLSTNVAVRSASYGIKTLLIDFDPEACATNALVSEDLDLSASKVLYHSIKENFPLKDLIIPSKYPWLDIIPSSLVNHRAEKEVIASNPKKIIRDRIKDLDYGLIFLELPPSFTTLIGSAYLAADLIILPCTPNIYSLESIALTIEAIDSLSNEFEVPERNYKILMNQYNEKRIASQQILAELMESYRSKVLPTPIKYTAEIENTTNAGLSVFEGGSKGVRENFNDLTLNICGINK